MKRASCVLMTVNPTVNGATHPLGMEAATTIAYDIPASTTVATILSRASIVRLRSGVGGTVGGVGGSGVRFGWFGGIGLGLAGGFGISGVGGFAWLIFVTNTVWADVP